MFYVLLNGITLTIVYMTTILGIIIYDKLNWKEHVKMIQSTVSKSTTILYKAFYVMCTVERFGTTHEPTREDILQCQRCLMGGAIISCITSASSFPNKMMMTMMMSTYDY